MSAVAGRTIDLYRFQGPADVENFLKSLRAQPETVDVVQNGRIIARIVPIFRELRDGILDELLDDDYRPCVQGNVLLGSFLNDATGVLTFPRENTAITVSDTDQVLIRIDAVTPA